MSATDVEKMMKHHLAVADVIACAMRDYATTMTGSRPSKACFEFEADAVMGALARAGYQIVVTRSPESTNG